MRDFMIYDECLKELGGHKGNESFWRQEPHLVVSREDFGKKMNERKINWRNYRVYYSIFFFCAYLEKKSCNWCSILWFYVKKTTGNL